MRDTGAHLPVFAPKQRFLPATELPELPANRPAPHGRFSQPHGRQKKKKNAGRKPRKIAQSTNSNCAISPCSKQPAPFPGAIQAWRAPHAPMGHVRISACALGTSAGCYTHTAPLVGAAHAPPTRWSNTPQLSTKRNKKTPSLLQRNARAAVTQGRGRMAL